MSLERSGCELYVAAGFCFKFKENSTEINNRDHKCIVREKSNDWHKFESFLFSSLKSSAAAAAADDRLLPPTDCCRRPTAAADQLLIERLKQLFNVVYNSRAVSLSADDDIRMFISTEVRQKQATQVTHLWLNRDKSFITI